MLRMLFWLAVGVAVWIAGSSVKLGKRTLFEHVAAVWKTDEMQEMKSGIQEATGPAVERVRRGVAAGVHAAQEPGAPQPAASSNAAPVVDAPLPPAEASPVKAPHPAASRSRQRK